VESLSTVCESSSKESSLWEVSGLASRGKGSPGDKMRGGIRKVGARGDW